jgi:NTP pyrophosphatase (non-canonical NTP hydrolase)
MKEFFQEHEVFEEDRPAMHHFPIWWLEKHQEELDELYVITSNDPLEQDKPRMLEELADVFLTTVGFARSIGATPKEFEEAVIAQIDKMHQTYPVELFDGSIPFAEAYKIARPDKVKPIDVFNQSVSVEDNQID